MVFVENKKHIQIFLDFDLDQPEDISSSPWAESMGESLVERFQINILVFPSLRGAKRRSNLIDFAIVRDCFAAARNDSLLPRYLGIELLVTQ